MPRLSGAQALARALRAEGIEVLFGIVGTHNVQLFDGLYEVPEIRVIAARHEGSMGFMADGYARATGRIAACLVVPGPGVTNLMTALGQAYLDSSPILALAGQNPTQTLDRRREEFHELHGQLEVVTSVTKRAERLLHPSEAPAMVRRAIETMRSGRPQPTFIEVPLDVASAVEDVVELEPTEALPERPRGDAESIESAASLLRAASRPVVVAGGGVISAEAGPVLRQLAYQLGAPVLATVHGRGAVADDDPLSVGDGWSHHHFVDEFLDSADACLAVGTNFETVTDFWRGARLPSTLVHVDIDPTAIGRHRPATVGIVGDARLVLERLLAELRGVSREVWCDTAAVRAAKRNAMLPVAGPVIELLDSLRAVLPRDAIVTDDLCLPGYWSPLALDVFEPRTLLHPGMFGTLGFSLPAAVGAAIGRPERAVVSLSGDGGFLYSSQELATAVQQQLNMVAVVFNDNAYGALRLYQDRVHERRRIGTDLRSPDFAALGNAYGAIGTRVSDASKLAAAVGEAIERGGVHVIECPLGEQFANIPPPWL